MNLLPLDVLSRLKARTLTIIQLTLLACAATSTAWAAGEVDQTFNGGAFYEPLYVYDIKRQDDGKILVGGRFDVANGATRISIVRLNADLSVDTTFNPPHILQGTIRAIAIQPDGKILIGGNLLIPLLTNWTCLARLNSDGSFDNSFSTMTVVQDSTGQNAVYDLALSDDGKVVIAGKFSFNAPSGGTRSKFARMNADGSVDDTFNPPGPFVDIVDISIQPDGKIVGATIDGGGGSRFIKRYNVDGTEDTSFIALATGSVNAIKIESNGQIFVGGDFTFVNNEPRVDIARLNANGSLDTTFNLTTAGNAYVNVIDSDADGKILIGGRFSAVNGVTRTNIARVDASGNLDPDLSIDGLASDAFVQRMLLLPNGRIDAVINAVAGIGGQRVISLTHDGALDSNFVCLAGSWGTVKKIAVQPDGKILIAGTFSVINSSLQRFGRFNPDGSTDETFNSTFSSLPVSAIAVQPDGKILVGIQGSTPLRRLNPDGSEDGTFIKPTLSVTINDIVVQPDGKILIVASGTVRRVNSNGSQDATFSTTLTGGANRAVLQPDGKILIAGDFSFVNSIPRGRIARLNDDGSLDSTFNPIGGASNVVYDIALQSDGKILIGGGFLNYNGTVHNYIVRLNADGNPDESFAIVPSGTVRALTAESNGKILVGGDFSTVNGIPLNKMTRLNPDGTLDAAFNNGIGTGAGPYGSIYSVVLQPDNKIVVGGLITIFNEVPKASVVRLLNDAPTAARTAFDFDGDGRADVVVFRPSNGFWYQLLSQDGSFNAVPFGLEIDRLAPADYDGDGRTDVAVFRDTVPGAGSLAYFYITQSSDNSFLPIQFGSTGDVPVSGDWDGDGKDDLAVYRDGAATGGQSYFYYRPTGSPGVNFEAIPWGGSGDKPLAGDFDGDGKQDAAVFRPSNSTWYILRSSDGQASQQTYGISGDIPTPADFDGNGTTNIAVYRPSTGTWYTSNDPQTNYGAIYFGTTGDIPVPADYDGDRKADAAVFRPTSGIWYFLRSTQGFTAVQFGASGDRPAPNAFIP